MRDGRTKAKLPIILTVAYFYEQVRRADGGMGGWGDGGMGGWGDGGMGVLKNISLFLP